MKTQIGRWGNSLGLRIPKQIVEELGLQVGDEVDCFVESGKIAIEMMNSSSDPTLDELVKMPLEWEGELDWGNPQAEEVW